MAELNDDIRTVIGKLLLHAGDNPLVKAVINSYEPSAKRTANLKSFSKFNLDVLEPCATFLCIELADSEGHKLFTKETLVSRILLAFMALLPSTCSECHDQYSTELEAQSPPLFKCHMCFQGSHGCTAIQDLHTALSSASISLSAGHVWLCNECLGSSKPVKPRKSKQRHDSISSISSVKSDPAIERLRSESMNSTTDRSFESPASASSRRTVVRKDSKPLNDVNIQPKPRDNVNDICFKYRAGKCPHGLSGKKVVDDKFCDGQHPERCMKFCKFGSKHVNGCDKGRDCDLFHPIICKFSLRNGKCKNNKCTFVHLSIGKTKTAENGKPGSRGKQGGNDKKGDFLLLQGLVEQMQKSFNQQLSDIRASLHQHQQHRPYHYPYPVPPGPFHPMNQMLGPQVRHVPNNLQGGMTFIPPPSC